MHDDDSQPRPARSDRRVPSRVRRLASPATLIMAGFCLLLPFMTASCTDQRLDTQWRVTYTGIDVITGGRPDVAFTENAHEKPIHTLDDAEVRQLLGKPPTPLPPQLLAWLAAWLMLSALAATALPSRPWRATLTAGLALAAAVVLWGATVQAQRDATDWVATVISQAFMPRASPPPTVSQVRQWQDYGRVRDTFHYAYGLWIAIALLSAVGLANAVRAVRDPAFDRDVPAATAADS